MSHAEPVRGRKRRKTKLLCDYWTIKFLSSRRSKLTTSGPWIQVIPQVRLRDASIQIDEQDGLVAVWAVGTKGDVLYRHGVTGECPQVHSFNSWHFVPAIWKRGVARQQGGVFNTTEMWRKRPVERLCFKWPAARFIPSKSWIYLSKKQRKFLTKQLSLIRDGIGTNWEDSFFEEQLQISRRELKLVLKWHKNLARFISGIYLRFVGSSLAGDRKQERNV